MDTESLIRGLSQDAASPPSRLAPVLAGAVVAAALAALLVWLVLLGPRPDIAAAAQTLRFPFKFVVTLALVAAAIAVWRRLAVPAAPLAAPALLLLGAPLLLAAGIALEFLAVPPGERMVRMIGTNAALCLTFIPLIGAIPLALLVWGMRRGAPTRPMLAGAACGLLAGGLAATAYAAHCIDDSPFFVAVWYVLAIALLALAGAAAGRVFLRW